MKNCNTPHAWIILLLSVARHISCTRKPPKVKNRWTHCVYFRSCDLWLLRTPFTGRVTRANQIFHTGFPHENRAFSTGWNLTSICGNFKWADDIEHVLLVLFRLFQFRNRQYLCSFGSYSYSGMNRMLFRSFCR